MTGPAVEYLFITSDVLVSIDGQVTGLSASTRLGCIEPMRALIRLGYDARTYSIAPGTAAAEALVPAARRVVFAEMCDSAQGWGPAIEGYRKLLRLVPDAAERAVFSIADDHFDDPDFSAFYRDVLPRCRAVTTVSPELANTVARLTARPVRVAPEPCEGPRGEAHAYAARRPPAPLGWLARRIGLSEDLWRVRLLWFGYPMNLPPLIAVLPALEKLARKHPLLLTCVTNPVAELSALLTPERTSERAALRMRFVPWAPRVVERELAAADMVLIPSEYRDPVKQAKSPNRLVAGLHGGRFVVAHPLPAYGPFRAFAWIGENLVEGIEWAIKRPNEVLARIARGQAYIDEHHSPEVVARFWLDIFDKRSGP